VETVHRTLIERKAGYATIGRPEATESGETVDPLLMACISRPTIMENYIPDERRQGDDLAIRCVRSAE
jgi:hypothetical protein